MKKESLLIAYKELYFRIIDPIFDKICNAKPDTYCVKTVVDNKPVQYAIYDKFRYYMEKAQKYMVKNGNLDRHKVASCLCGAIVRVQPLCLISLKKDQINEIAAMYAGLSVIEYYMRNVFIEDLSVSEEEGLKILAHLKTDFHMRFPGNVCDVKSYEINLINALYRTHTKCEDYYNGKECFQYDIWAYAKIFYHLELHNQKFMRESYERYLANQKQDEKEGWLL